METICYALPLAPQDLVGIYKEKDESEKEYILYVDYDKTTEKLTDQHILIYLANTNFKTSFDKVTPSLVQEFIKTNFIVHCPMLSRVVAMILKVYLKWDLTDGEKLLTQNLFTMEQIDEFIKLNMNLIEDLIEVIQGLFPYTLWKLHSHMDDPSIEPNLVQIVEEIEVVDHPLNIGPNIARLVTDCVDVLYLVFHVRGVSQTFNKQIYNDSPKYHGSDLFYLMNQTKIVNCIIEMLPEDFWHDKTE